MASADFEFESQIISYFKCKEQSNQIQTYLSTEENDKLIISYLKFQQQFLSNLVLHFPLIYSALWKWCIICYLINGIQTLAFSNNLLALAALFLDNFLGSHYGVLKEKKF